MKDIGNGTTIIRNFNTLPKASLEILKSNLGLRTSIPELLYCARHYSSKNGNDICVDALRFIDALACPAHVDASKVAISELLTNAPYVAETYKDFIEKAHALGKPADHPYTLSDVAQMPAAYLCALQDKQPAATEQIGMRCGNASYAPQGYAVQYRLAGEHGGFDVLQHLPLKLQAHAAYADALVLLYPNAELSRDQYDRALLTLLSDPEVCTHLHCLQDCALTSIAHAVLSVSNGAVLNLGKLPEHMQSLDSLTGCTSASLLALPQGKVQELEQKAAACSLCLSFFGVADHAGQLIVRHGKKILLAMNVSYLKSVCFIRSYSLRIEQEASQYVTDQSTPPYAKSIPLVATGYQTVLQSFEPGSTVLRSLSPLRTRNMTYTELLSDPFHRALMCAADAYCTAVAAGCNPERITLHARLCTDIQGMYSAAMSRSLAALLGLYRFSLETSVKIYTQAELGAQQSDLLVLASAPSDMIIPSTLQGNAKIYLLHPLYNEYGMPDLQDLGKMIAYVRTVMCKGAIKSARAVCGCTVEQTLSDMTSPACGYILNTERAKEISLRYPGAILIESDSELEGLLVAVSTSVKAAPAPTQPCSDVWYQLPVASVLQCGNALEGQHICDVLEMAGAQPALFEVKDDPDCYNPLSAKLRASQIAVFIGSREQTLAALSNQRMRSALQEMTAKDGCILALGAAADAFAELGVIKNVPIQTVEAEYADVSAASEDFRLIGVQGRVRSESGMLNVCPDQAGLLRILVNDTLYSDGFCDESGRIMGFFFGCTDKILENSVKYYV